MNPFKIKLVCFTLILLIAGCREKDELTLPVKVYLEVGISPENSPESDYLYFTEGKIMVSNVKFEGTREAGGNIFFETDQRDYSQTIVFSKHPAIISEYDIPQGIFNYMKWDIYMNCLDMNDYDLNESGLCEAIEISGYYEFLNGAVIPLIFSYDTDWAGSGFNVRSENPDGISRIVLSVNKEYAAIVLFSPETAFNSINRQSLEEAEISENNGNQSIVISSSQNTDLYEILSYRIFQSAKSIVK